MKRKNNTYHIFCFILVLVTLFSCNYSKVEEVFTMKKIHKYTIGEPEIPFFEDNNIKFILLSDSRLVTTSVFQLYGVYLDCFKYKYLSFECFLYDVLNFKLILNENLFQEKDNYIFTLQERLVEEYIKNDITYLLGRYCKKEAVKYYVDNKMSIEDKFTILYYAYLNKYNVYIDEGYFVVMF